MSGASPCNRVTACSMNGSDVNVLWWVSVIRPIRRPSSACGSATQGTSARVTPR